MHKEAVRIKSYITSILLINSLAIFGLSSLIMLSSALPLLFRNQVLVE